MADEWVDVFGGQLRVSYGPDVPLSPDPSVLPKPRRAEYPIGYPAPSLAPGFRNIVWRDEPDGTRTIVSADWVEVSLVPPGWPPFKDLDADGEDMPVLR